MSMWLQTTFRNMRKNLQLWFTVYTKSSAEKHFRRRGKDFHTSQAFFRLSCTWLRNRSWTNSQWKIILWPRQKLLQKVQATHVIFTEHLMPCVARSQQNEIFLWFLLGVLFMYKQWCLTPNLPLLPVITIGNKSLFNNKLDTHSIQIHFNSLLHWINWVNPFTDMAMISLMILVDRSSNTHKSLSQHYHIVIFNRNS